MNNTQEAGARSGFRALPVNDTGMPLTVPDGFRISVFAKNLGSPRVLAMDPAGTLLTSITGQGKIAALVDENNDGISDRTITVLSGLNKPHGMAFRDGKLYVAETNAVSAYNYDPTSKRASGRKTLLDLPSGGNHFTRTLGFGPDGRMYVSIGSTCNVCVEKDPRRASILVADADGTNVRTYATGLRNAVFFTWNPVDGRLWTTNMGRDNLGDNTPPETVNIISEGDNFGWPYCFGMRIWDKTFDASKRAEVFCKTTAVPHIEYQAHSAPLGLAFVPKSWPEQFRNSLLVAFHGSWNRSAKTGYKIVRFVLDDNGNYVSADDFISGWLNGSGVSGRPVDLLLDSRGVLYITDDKAGVIYRLSVQR